MLLRVGIGIGFAIGIDIDSDGEPDSEIPSEHSIFGTTLITDIHQEGENPQPFHLSPDTFSVTAFHTLRKLPPRILRTSVSE